MLLYIHRVNKNKQRKCPLCEYSAKTTQNLKNHVSIEHSLVAHLYIDNIKNEVTFCPLPKKSDTSEQCGKECNQYNIAWHVNSIHGITSPENCILFGFMKIFNKYNHFFNYYYQI